MESSYDDVAKVAAQVKEGLHRELVGGLWNDLGRLQLAFMQEHGLQPHHHLLDLGCGALRGGVQFVGYLQDENYYGLDNNQSLLDAGYEIELVVAGLQSRLPRRNLVCNAEFEVPVADGFFDFGIAQSLFTHMSFNSIRRCLETVVPKFRIGGVLYATFFELPEHLSSTIEYRQGRGEVVTYGHKDPYHYRRGDLIQAAAGGRWKADYVGDWNHPRGQVIMAFERIS